MIIKEGSLFKVLSTSGKNMGKFKSKKKAEERLRQIEYFKHKSLLEKK